MAVITISRQIGSGGDEIADRLCQVLGYKEFDKRLIAQAAGESGLSEDEVLGARLDDFSDDNRKMGNFLDRLFNRSGVVLQTRVWKDPASGGPAYEEVRLSEEAVVALVEHAIRLAHSAGNCIIIGRGGQALLQNRKDVIHIRIEAPLEERVQHVKEQFKHSRQSFHADLELRREAQDWIDKRDAASTDYLRRFYEINWANPLLYHLVINTGKVSIDQAVEMITRLVVELVPAQRAKESEPEAEQS
jgi:CMP/dCMP kinase